MLYENWWHISSQSKHNIHCHPLTKNISSECVVIGAGFAGLHAALRLIEAGKQVVLLEKTVCGGSSSGQSGGFLTPESEEDTDKLIKKYGKDKAETIYNIPLTGLNLITGAIKKYGLNCDFRKQDSLYLSIKEGHDEYIEEEAQTRKDLHLPYTLLDKNQLKKVHPGKGYRKGLLYPGSYGINSYAWTQEMKDLLLRKGVKIYEGTEVDGIEGNLVKTSLGSVRAKHILICIDKMKSEFNSELSKHFYHIQTHIAVSEPLSKKAMNAIFPLKEIMCWDSSITYSYYRPIEDNRLVLGGARYTTSYSKSITHEPEAIMAIINELRDRFPVLKQFHFPHYWSGLIDVTRDLTPIADYDPKNKSIQYAMGCAGLPWAAFCGDYLARRVIDPKSTEDLSDILGIHRKHFLPLFFQSLFGKRVTFGLSHLKQLFS